MLSVIPIFYAHLEFYGGPRNNPSLTELVDELAEEVPYGRVLPGDDSESEAFEDGSPQELEF